MNRKAIEDHYRANFKRLVTILSQKHGWHNAEDIVQDVYVSALECPDKIENVEAFIVRVMYAKKVDLVREAIRHREMEEKLIKNAEGDPVKPVGNTGVPTPSPEEIHFYNSDVVRLQDLIKARPVRHASILTMAILHMEPYEKIQAKTGAPIGTIKRIVHYFREEAAEAFK